MLITLERSQTSVTRMKIHSGTNQSHSSLERVSWVSCLLDTQWRRALRLPFIHPVQPLDRDRNSRFKLDMSLLVLTVVHLQRSLRKLRSLRRCLAKKSIGMSRLQVAKIFQWNSAQMCMWSTCSSTSQRWSTELMCSTERIQTQSSTTLGSTQLTASMTTFLTTSRTETWCSKHMEPQTLEARSLQLSKPYSSQLLQPLLEDLDLLEV